MIDWGSVNSPMQVDLLDSEFNAVVSDIPINWGIGRSEELGARDPDIAYGEVDGESRFLLVYTDINNCVPGHTECVDEWLQARGVWGLYVDPLKATYPPSLASDPFPISWIDRHFIIEEWPVQAPKVSHSPDGHGFFVAWYEVPGPTSEYGEVRTHIRGAFVDYLGGFGRTNAVLSDVTGGTLVGGYYESAENPQLPAVAALDGLSAAVVWQQRYPDNPADLDVKGDIYTASPSLPDLAESAVSDPPAGASPGSFFSVSDTLYNIGLHSSGPSTTRYYLSFDTALGRWDILLASRAVPALAHLESNDGSIRVVPIPNDVAGGRYYLLACADGPGTVTESDEANNCKASTGTILISAQMPPDLVAASVGNPPANAAPGSSFDARDTTVNGGAMLAGASQTRYYLSADTIRGAGDTLLTGARAVPALAPGAESIGTVSVTVPTIPPGTYYLLACADDTDVVSEANEGNNCAASATTVAVSALALKTASEFTGDGKRDVLWRHDSRGEVWLWPMDGPVPKEQAYVRTVADTNWEIRGLGDQTGDGQADILWRNALTGQIYFWHMVGGRPFEESFVSTVELEYDVVGTGDFNGDGKSDILWRQPVLGDVWIWLMDGATTLSQTFVERVDPAYVVKGVGDLNADGKDDIVWHHATAGEVWVWLMNGPTRLTMPLMVSVVPDTRYQIVGVADFTGDGKADLLWHHDTFGEVWVWTMNGATRLSETYVATVSDTGYRIVGCGDYNADARAEILWRHGRRGEIWLWLMNGTALLSSQWVATVPDIGYQVMR